MYYLLSELKDDLRSARYLIDKICADSREKSLALTKMDECEMWLERAIIAKGEVPEHRTQG